MFKKFKLNKAQYPFSFEKYLTKKNLALFIILTIFYILFPNYVQPLVLIVIIYPLSFMSIRTSKYVKYLNTELVTPFTLFIGYIYGWKWAAFYGFGLGLFMWAQTAINTMTILNCLTYLLSAFLGHFAAIWFPGNFLRGYLVAVTIRNVITYLMFLVFNPDPFENLTHTSAAFITNTLILPIFLDLLYKLIIFITP